MSENTAAAANPVQAGRPAPDLRLRPTPDQFVSLRDFRGRATVCTDQLVLLFLIDESGLVRWSYAAPMGVNPGANGILRALGDLVAKKGAR